MAAGKDRNALIEWDARLSRRVFAATGDSRVPWIRAATRWACFLLEIAGHGVLWLAGVPLLALRWAPPMLMAGLVLDVLIVGVLKLVVRRPRPPYNHPTMHVSFKIDRESSFPSGHSSRAAFLFVFFAAYVDAPSLRLPLLLASALVPPSRVMLGRHYVLDSLAGTLCGLFVGAATYLLRDFYEPYYDLALSFWPL